MLYQRFKELRKGSEKLNDLREDLNTVIPKNAKFYKGAFLNYVDQQLALFDHLPTSGWHFY